MDENKVEEALVEALTESNDRKDVPGEYHPSEISGCPLKVVLDKATQKETIYNCWLLQGTAVHYWLQESGVMDSALMEAGYHPVDTKYEVPNDHELSDRVSITGTCDILTSNGDGETTIFDIKYSSLTPGGGHGRLMKYFSQLNTYAFMFGADEYALMMINSKSKDLLGMKDNSERDIRLMQGEPNEENWEIVTNKALAIDKALRSVEAVDGDEYVKVAPLDELSLNHEVVEIAMDVLDESHMPAYEEECNYCPHKDHCPAYQEEDDSGFGSFGD